MRKLAYILVISGLVMISFALSARQVAASDSFIRSHVVKLYTKVGSCTGSLAKANSRVVILTAAHCRAILVGHKAWAEREDGSKYIAEMIKYDATTDLMVMTTPDKTYLPTAITVSKHERVHSITHGGGHMSYRADGELMEEETGDVAMFIVDGPVKHWECVKEKNQREVPVLFGLLCVTRLTNTWSSMVIMPGSSGGAVLNERGEIVGVVSTGDERISGLVPLRYVKAILNF